MVAEGRAGVSVDLKPMFTARVLKDSSERGEKLKEFKFVNNRVTTVYKVLFNCSEMYFFVPYFVAFYHGERKFLTSV